MNNFRYSFFAIILAIQTFGLTGCYYDNEEELYQFVTPATCDTVDVSYVQQILPILQDNCYQCHAQSLAFGNVVLEGYNEVSIYAQNGRLLGAVSHAEGFSPMPKGTNQLPACEVKLIKSWVQSGFPEN